ncbi:MAG: hypothetical protein WC180_05460 [Candidatus Paceibacterota bacterium]
MNKMINLLVVLLLLVALVPVGCAKQNTSLKDSVDIKQLNSDLLESIKSENGEPLAYNPKVLSFKKIETEDVANGVSKYRMEIKRGKGKINNLCLSIHIREDINAQNFKEFFGIFAGQSLSGKGGYYGEDYSDIEGARQGYVVVEEDRREVNFGADDKEKANKEMSKQDIMLTLEDCYVEQAVSKLLISQITGIAVEDIETTNLGHSLGGHCLIRYGGSFYQNTVLGHIDHFIIVDTIVRYDEEYGDLEAGQLENYYKMIDEINSENYVADGMNTSIGLAQKVRDGDLISREIFLFGVSKTYLVKMASFENPYTPEYHYWPADVDIDLLADKMCEGAVNPYSSRKLDSDMTGTMAKIVDVNDIVGAKSILVVSLGGGFDPAKYGRQWFENQAKNTHTDVTFYDGGDSGHGFMFNKDTPKNWKYIWAYTNKMSSAS